MPWRGYLYLAKLRMHTQFAYRIEAFAGAIGTFLSVICAVFLWKAAFRDGGSVNGVNEHQMIVYMVLSVALKDVFYCRTQDDLALRVSKGDIALDLVKPCEPLIKHLVEDLAMSLTAIIRRLLPIVLVASWIFRTPIPFNPVTTMLTVVSGALGFIILWSLSALTGMATFWFLDLGGLGFAKDVIVRLLSGSIVPIWFFPDWYQPISRWLPFEHSYQTMLGIYIGKTPPGESWTLMLIQFLWAVALVFGVIVTWRAARHRVLVQGG